MEDLSREALKNLIVAVSGLCEHTRGLAQGEASGPQAMAPIQHSVAAVAAAVEVVQAMWDAEVSTASLPEAAPEKDESWLLGEDFV